MFDRKYHWQKAYQEKAASEVSWYQKEPIKSLALIRSTQVDNNEPIIDIGGGTSTLIDHLYKQGFTQLTVLDIAKNALLLAKKRLGDTANNITWFEADITQFKIPYQVSVWHDRALFHFLTDNIDRAQYIKTLKNTLRPGGHLIIATFAINGAEKCSGLEIVQYDAKKLNAILGEEFRLMQACDELHITPMNKEQQFTYCHFIRTKA